MGKQRTLVCVCVCMHVHIISELYMYTSHCPTTIPFIYSPLYVPASLCIPGVATVCLVSLYTGVAHTSYL